MGSAAANTALHRTDGLIRDVEKLDARVSSLERVIKPVPTFWVERKAKGIMFSVGETKIGEALYRDGLTLVADQDKFFRTVAKALGAPVKDITS